jgi:uncharacterized protein YbaR (Trm112 family)
MRSTLLGFLACPQCRGEFDLHATSTGDNHIQEGLLHCYNCAARYPIRGGIPRSVPDAAYARSFSFEWKQ